ncbi:MAG: OmpA family protein [Proteobacteria bacterium]|nr:OmpA family protein [Pseudomonadota bacterium]
MSRSARARNGVKPHYFGETWIDVVASSSRTRWIISYADMMTIIVTFFILLLSISTIAQTRFDLLVQALTGQRVGNLQEVKIKVDDFIHEANLGAEVMTNIDDRGLTIQFSNALLFDSGQAELTTRAADVVSPIGKYLVDDLEPEYGLIIEGYTDDVPISNQQFQSNWELSTSRAIHVMRRLAEAGLAQERMSVQGFADTRAATSIDLHDRAKTTAMTAEELADIRAANRRVVIRIDRLHADVLNSIHRAGADVPPSIRDAAPPGARPGNTNIPRVHDQFERSP